MSQFTDTIDDVGQVLPEVTNCTYIWLSVSENAEFAVSTMSCNNSVLAAACCGTFGGKR
jgi:protein involved in temperature-dependent protein secretion